MTSEEKNAKLLKEANDLYLLADLKENGLNKEERFYFFLEESEDATELSIESLKALGYAATLSTPLKAFENDSLIKYDGTYIDEEDIDDIQYDVIKVNISKENYLYLRKTLISVGNVASLVNFIKES